MLTSGCFGQPCPVAHYEEVCNFLPTGACYAQSSVRVCLNFSVLREYCCASWVECASLHCGRCSLGIRVHLNEHDTSGGHLSRDVHGMRVADRAFTEKGLHTSTRFWLVLSMQCGAFIQRDACPSPPAFDLHQPSHSTPQKGHQPTSLSRAAPRTLLPLKVR